MWITASRQLDHSEKNATDGKCGDSDFICRLSSSSLDAPALNVAVSASECRSAEKNGLFCWRDNLPSVFPCSLVAGG